MIVDRERAGGPHRAQSEQGHDSGEPGGGCIADRLAYADEPADARQQRSASRRHGQVERHAADLFQLRESPRVYEGVATSGNRQIVAAVLPLLAYFLSHPPDRGMIEQQCFDGRLQHVQQVIVAADVRQFVSQDGLHHLRGQARERAYRKQNHGAQPADHHGYSGDGGLAQRNLPHNAQTVREARQNLLPRRLGWSSAVALESLRENPAAGGAQREHHNTRSPRADQPYHVAIQPLLHTERRLRGDRPCSHRATGQSCRQDGCQCLDGRRSESFAMENQPEERTSARGQHRQHGCVRGCISQAGAGFPHQQVGAAEQYCDEHALPQKVQQSPAQGQYEWLP